MKNRIYFNELSRALYSPCAEHNEQIAPSSLFSLTKGAPEMVFANKCSHCSGESTTTPVSFYVSTSIALVPSSKTRGSTFAALWRQKRAGRGKFFSRRRSSRSEISRPTKQTAMNQCTTFCLLWYHLERA